MNKLLLYAVGSIMARVSLCDTHTFNISSRVFFCFKLLVNTLDLNLCQSGCRGTSATSNATGCVFDSHLRKCKHIFIFSNSFKKCVDLHSIISSISYWKFFNFQEISIRTQPKIIRIERIIKYKEYHAPKLYNDIALLELAESVEFGPLIRPACLWTNMDTSSLGTLSVSGWGVVDPSKLFLSPLFAIYSKCWDRPFYNFCANSSKVLDLNAAVYLSINSHRAHIKRS